jgi:hypothetical protein
LSSRPQESRAVRRDVGGKDRHQFAFEAIGRGAAFGHSMPALSVPAVDHIEDAEFCHRGFTGYMCGVQPAPRPELAAKVKYLTWTGDNLLRQVVYEGQREDKPASELRREVPHAKHDASGSSR